MTLSNTTKSKAGPATSEYCKFNMSFNAVREDFWQSTARSTIRERCKSIFNQELFSDVNFVVRDSYSGNESKTIPAHKFVLAISCPVFLPCFTEGPEAGIKIPFPSPNFVQIPFPSLIFGQIPVPAVKFQGNPSASKIKAKITVSRYVQ